MKKISTLVLAAFMVITASAANRPPKVMLNTAGNYDVRIDGRLYKGDDYNLRSLGNGVHTLQVYKTGSGMFKRKTLVSTEQFNLRNNDITIDVNQFGRTRITEDRFNGGKGGWDNDRSTGRNDNNGRDYNGYGYGRH